MITGLDGEAMTRGMVTACGVGVGVGAALTVIIVGAATGSVAQPITGAVVSRTWR